MDVILSAAKDLSHFAQGELKISLMGSREICHALIGQIKWMISTNLQRTMNRIRALNRSAWTMKRLH